MTPDQFRRLALALPHASEGVHQGHADFRLRGKVFATLGYPDAAHGMVKLSAEQQEAFVRVDAAFAPAAGAWGRQGSTIVALKAARVPRVRDALQAAWTTADRTAPRGRPSDSPARTRRAPA